MFAWYKASEVCYAYLADVKHEEDMDTRSGQALANGAEAGNPSAPSPSLVAGAGDSTERHEQCGPTRFHELYESGTKLGSDSIETTKEASTEETSDPYQIYGLADAIASDRTSTRGISNGRDEAFKERFKACKWFTRG